jgi:tetratricopeptide (TPR) repeat protein
VVTYLAQHSGHAVIPLALLPLEYRLENPVVAMMRYVLKILWPTGLAFIYPYRPIPAANVILALIALGLISTAVWRARAHNRCWLTGWLWFLGSLVPVIGFVQVGNAAMADRYSYIPSIGIFVAAAFGLYALPWSRKLFPVIAALPLIACVLATERQLVFWRSSEAVLRHTIAVTPDNEIAHFMLAVDLDREGRYAESLGEFREVLRINPVNDRIHFHAGNVLMKLGRPAGALAEYRECLTYEPDKADVHNAAACALAAQDDLAGALPEFVQAERLDPRYVRPHLELAKIYFRQGADGQAADELWTAVRIQPNDVPTLTTAAHYLAANTNAAARDGHGAVVLALQAYGLSDRREPDVLDALGMAFAATGDFSDAITCAQNALEFSPAAKPDATAPMRLRLALYQKQQPWLESFRATNAPPIL